MLSNYLSCLIIIWIMYVSAFLSVKRVPQLRHIIISLFILITVTSIGPWSAMNLPEALHARQLKSAYASIKDKLGREHIPIDRLRGEERNDVCRTLVLLDRYYGYSMLTDRVREDSPQVIWFVFRCEGYDAVKLLRVLPKDVSTYLMMLYSFDSKRCWWAASYLGKLGERALPAVPHLIEMLDGSTSFYMHSVSVINSARDALIRIGDPAVPYLLNAFRNRNRSIAFQAMEALQEIKEDKGRKVLTAFLRDPSSSLRVRSAEFLGVLRINNGTSWIGEALIESLRDPEPDVRKAAAESLGRLRYKRATESLLWLLADQKTAVSMQAVKSLAMIDDLMAVGPLIDLLQASEENVQMAVTKALQRITDENFGQDRKKWQEWWRSCMQSRLKAPSPPLPLLELADKPIFSYPDLEYSRE
jgi:hypothetical protein